MGGGRLREVNVHRGLTLCFIRSTFTGTLNHSRIVLNTQIAKKLLFQTILNKIQFFLAQSFSLMTRVDMTIIDKLFILVCNSHNVCQSVKC